MSSDARPSSVSTDTEPHLAVPADVDMSVHVLRLFPVANGHGILQGWSWAGFDLVANPGCNAFMARAEELDVSSWNLKLSNTIVCASCGQMCVVQGDGQHQTRLRGATPATTRERWW